MRGFVFSLDMALAAAGVVLLFLILIQSVDFPFPPTLVTGRILAKDATMMWFYGAPASVLTPPLPPQYACDTGFRPRVDTAPLDPLDDASWVTQENCVEVS
jgi:hypothetical protein